ncbi:molybdate ABC transporter permease subunit [Clostridium sp. MT-14]|uniref:Molybdenum transport system permease n=1 Tax=Clostridium aromativorans TaxID=2836848 RepID=A0ABS8N6Y2_9CLOT|nr:molybdate ABC transporter permease subunit [Clostridium aromativorans]MCC9295547.1 molybdate ABC transporter permease subunit [Clostridium aromativorans]CAB1245980.1 molybdenum transport permease [Clostridiaceae bacterium BL-3]
MDFDISPAWISIKTVFVATTITFFVGIIAAYWMANYNGKLKSTVDTIFTLPLVLPPTVVGFFLLLIFGRNGPIGKLLLKFGTTLIFSWPATVVAAAIVAFPLMYRTTKGAFEQIDHNIVNAARTLGVSEWKVFWRVILPLARPGIGAATVLSFARCLGEFGATLMVAGNIPGKTQTIPIAIYFTAENGEMRNALIWVILIVIISTIMIFLMNYWNEYQQKNIYGVGRK